MAQSDQRWVGALALGTLGGRETTNNQRHASGCIRDASSGNFLLG